MRSMSGNDASLSVNLPTTVVQERNGKTSGWSRRSYDESAPPSRGLTKASSVNSMSPEPWPQVNEEEFDKSPSPPPMTAGTSASSIREGGESMAVNIDMRSDKTPLSSVQPSRIGLSSRERARESPLSRSALQSRESVPGRPSLSRESTSMHSDKLVKMMETPVVDSPGPPPPSPEPKEPAHIVTVEPLSKENTGLSGALEDILETDSEFTISARPPSNLDDSTMNTPTVPIKHPGNAGTTKHSQLAQYLGTRSREQTQDMTEESESTPYGNHSVLQRDHTKFTNTTVPSDSITIADSSADPPPQRSAETKHSQRSIIDARTLALQNASSQNTTFKSNSVARVAPANRVAVSNSVARGPNQNMRTVSREHQALDLVVTTSELKQNAERRALQLDQFDSTEDGFKRELKGEMDKLDKKKANARKGRRDSL